MTTAHRVRPRFSYADYLVFEADSGTKHEFVDGDIIAMAGGSFRHSALASRISAALEAGRGPGCIAFQSDLRIRVLATGRAAYPDAGVVCGPAELDPADTNGHTITNPTLIVEVLSPSTEEYDRTEKWADYQQISSLQEFVLVSQSRQRVETYRRLASGAWEYRDTREGTLTLSTGATLDLARLYADLPP